MKQAISVILAVLVGIGVAYAVFHFGGFGVPAPVRAAHALTSPDAQQRADAIAHWSEPAGPAKTPRLFTDFDVMDALRLDLPGASDQALRDLGDRFADAPQWIDQFPAAQERYLLILAADPDPSAGAEALRQIRRFNPSDELGRIANVLDKLTEHPDPAVRVAALEHAAYYLGRKEEPMVTKLLDDPDEHVARTAWLHMAFIDPASGHTAKWRDAPWRVGHAMLYAAALSNPDQVQAILKEAEDDKRLNGVLGGSAFLLKYIADGNPPDQYVPGENVDDRGRSLAEEARRAHWLLEGTHIELLRVPGDEPGGSSS
jgi:hypothetical protein